MLKYRVTHGLSTAYHPQISGQVEVSNRGLKRILERTVGENRASWSDKQDDALWAFSTAYKTPIECSPYKLVYEKACHLPIELEHKAYWALKHANFDLKTVGDHRKVQLNELNKLRDHAYENSLIYKEKTKRIHDSKIKNHVFNVSDQVLLFNSRLKMLSVRENSRRTKNDRVDYELDAKQGLFGNLKSSFPILVSVGCQKPSHLAARLGYAETKVATWDDLAFKLIILRKWISKKMTKKSKPKRQNRARERKERERKVKSKPEVNKKSKSNQVKVNPGKWIWKEHRKPNSKS
ncbi:reverse transcriptase domain-containing protein [Tanacetum coccineum]